MIVGYIAPYPPKQCGIAEYTYFLTNAVKNVKKDVEIVVFAENYSQEASGISVIEAFKRGNVDYDHLLKTVKEHGPFDVIHLQLAHGILPYEKGLVDFLKKLKDYTRGIVVTFHEVFRSEEKKRVEIQKQIVELTDFVTVHSHLQEFELHCQLQWKNSDKILLIPHGTRLFSTIERHRALSLLDINGLDIPDDHKVIGILGFIHPSKGIDLLVESLRKIIKDIPNIYLLVAGLAADSEYYKNMHEVIKESLPKKGIIINRWLSRTDIDLLYSLIDIVVLPYKDPYNHYSISGAFHYAIGSGRPVICAKANRLVECYLVSPKLTFAPNDVENLSCKIKRIIEFLDKGDVDISHNLENLRRFAERTSWDNIARKYLTLYDYLEKTPESQEKIKKDVLEQVTPDEIPANGFKQNGFLSG